MGSSSDLVGNPYNLRVSYGESFQESRMREIRTSGLTRGEAVTLPYSTYFRLFRYPLLVHLPPSA